MVRIACIIGIILSQVFIIIMKKIYITESSEEVVALEDELYILNITDLDETVNYVWDEVNNNYIQFHFVTSGKAKFYFNNSQYAIDLTKEESILLYNPDQNIPINVELDKSATLLSVIVKIETFHSFFSNESSYISFLSEENRHKKFYSKTPIPPQGLVVLSQMSKYRYNLWLKNLYLKGKVYELFCLYFNKPEEGVSNSCPFLMNADYLSKVRNAKDIVILHLSEPPGLEELAETVGLNVKKLKEGFKQVYGTSVFNFLFDYKMEYSRKLLESGEYNVNEIGLKIGYSAASHFIASFKKKFGTTPKKYLLSQS